MFAWIYFIAHTNIHTIYTRKNNSIFTAVKWQFVSIHLQAEDNAICYANEKSMESKQKHSMRMVAVAEFEMAVVQTKQQNAVAARLGRVA